MLGCPLTLVVGIASLAFCNAALFVNDQAYDNGEYGDYPAEFYKSSPVKGPLLNVYQYGTDCGQDGLYTMITPRGGAVGTVGPMVLDGNGDLIWFNENYAQPYNLQVQTYRGEPYLTFWAGDDGVRGHGAGMYYMLDSTYRESYVLGAASGLSGDLHEFKLTDDGTAMITVFAIFPADLTSIGGPQRGWIWEAVVQEIEVETNNLVFEWKASDHIPLTDTYRSRGNSGDSHDDPFDWFHINSVDKDQHGNYIISSRHLHSVTCIDGTTGEILWILGGKSNKFQDLSDGRATSFAWQHHARWRDNDTAITIFDNESEDTNPTGRASKGLHIALDTVAMTAEVKAEYVHTESADNHIDSLGHSVSQGSFEFLPNGNALLGYGFSAQWTEFSPDTGDVLCDVHFGPSSQFGWGGVQSYRVSKHPWVGKPSWAPSIAIEPKDNTISMSWLGSTETVRWRIEEAEKRPHKKFKKLKDLEFSLFKVVDKDGFETTTDLDGLQFDYVRVLALDQESNIIGVSEILDTKSLPQDDQAVEGSEPEPESTSVGKVVLFVCVAVLVAAFGTIAFWVGALFVRRRIQYRRLQHAADEEAEGKHLSSDTEVDDLDRDSVDLLPQPDEKLPFAHSLASKFMRQE